jgi:HflK protein
LLNSKPTSTRPASSGTIVLAALGAVALWVFSSLYTVKPEEQSVELFLGSYYKTGNPGLNFAPWPLVTKEIVNVTSERTEDIGQRQGRGNEGLMLTTDANIVDINFQVVWNISDPSKLLFNIRDAQLTVQAVSESVMREIIAASNLAPILNRDRGIIADTAMQNIQATMDEYESGIRIVRVNLDKADPPREVIDAFREVQAAEQERDRLQRQRSTKLLHHVGFGREIEIHLHGTRAVHHVETHAPDLLHVLGHDPVAALGHDGDLVAPPVGREAQAQKTDIVLAGDFLHLRQMVMHFRTGLVQVFQRRAGQLELAAGLQRDIAHPLAFQPDQIAALLDGLPAETLHAFEDRANAVLAVIGDGRMVLQAEGKFFVLGADAPVRFRLVAALQRPDQIVAARNGLRPCNQDTHIGPFPDFTALLGFYGRRFRFQSPQK